MQKSFPAWLLGVTLLLPAANSPAVDDYGRWYGTVMLSGIDEDKDRGLETEWSGFHLGFGRGIGRDWGIEMNLVGTRFKNSDGDLAARQWGVGADVTRRLFDTQHFLPYVVAGAGWMTTDHKLNRKDRDGAMVSVGAGLLMPIAPLSMSLRTELRARRDYGESALTDYLVSVGVKIPFGFVNLGPAVRRPLPDGRPHPESEARPYGWQADTDGDGVADISDRCPDSPAGAMVDEHGCAAADDADGDGVPDSADICPDTPRGTTIDKHGCRVDPPRPLDDAQLQ